jgi:hypothetical protein
MRDFEMGEWVNISDFKRERKKHSTLNIQHSMFKWIAFNQIQTSMNQSEHYLLSVEY